MDIDSLRLTGAADAGARALKKAHPDVVFTSGRREVADQARAMSGNVAVNRRWIGQTYANTPEARALQAWVNAHPEADTAGEIAAGLVGVMAGWTDVQKGRLSKHFSGQAFDVQPVSGPRGDAIKATIRALPGLVKFLDREGGLVRWHAQFA